MSRIIDIHSFPPCLKRGCRDRPGRTILTGRPHLPPLLRKLTRAHPRPTPNLSSPNRPSLSGGLYGRLPGMSSPVAGTRPFTPHPATARGIANGIATSSADVLGCIRPPTSPGGSTIPAPPPTDHARTPTARTRPAMKRCDCVALPAPHPLMLPATELIFGVRPIELPRNCSGV